MNWYKLFLNLTKFPISSFIANDDEIVKDLRAANPNTIFLKYKGIFYCWGEEIDQETEQSEIDVNITPYLLIRIIEQSLLSQFYEEPQMYIAKSFSGFTITDYRRRFFAEDYPYVELYRNIHIHFAPLFAGGSQNLGFSITTSIQERLNWTKEDFLENELDIEDLDFRESDGMVITTYLSKQRVVNFHGDATNLKSDIDAISHPMKEAQDVENFVREFFQERIQDFSLPGGLEVLRIDNPKIKVSAKTQGKIRALMFDTPTHYFYRGISPAKKNFGMRSKIRYNKPFTYDNFENRKINIGIIYPELYYLKIANFFKAIQKELTDIYRIPKENFRFTKFVIQDFQLSSYQAVMQSISEIDLAIVMVDESHEQLPVSQSPYFFCKAELLKRNINTQEVQLQQVNKYLEDERTNQTNYTDHNIALNIYAKLGGIGWTIKPENKRENELVFGVGATTDQNGQPVLGLTSVFRGDGKYIFGDVSSVVDIEDYSTQLKDLIIHTIERSIEAGIIDDQQEIRLIFHLFKKAGQYNEIDALDEAIRCFQGLSIRTCFVHVGDGHNFRFYPFSEVYKDRLEFDHSQFRGMYIRVNDRLAFLALRKNSPTLIKIDIDKRSNFKDIDYISKQVYEFAEISHTSFNKQQLPATIKYPKIMARMSGKLNLVEGFYLKKIGLQDGSLWFI